MENYPQVSVIIPNYNGEKYVEQAIRSVLDQTYENFELIIVDDMSTDDSIGIINKYIKYDNRVSLIRLRKNCGVAMARNIGIKKAAGKYIALLDNDDFWEDDKLERQVNLAMKGADIVYCSYDFVDENNNKIKKPFIVPDRTDYNKMLTSSVISCSSCFIKSDLLKDHLFKTQYYHEDYLLWMELLKLNVVVLGDSKVLMHYRQVKGSRSNKKVNAAKERWNIYRKALGLNRYKSILSFIQYALKGVIKYYL